MTLATNKMKTAPAANYERFPRANETRTLRHANVRAKFWNAFERGVQGFGFMFIPSDTRATPTTRPRLRNAAP